MLDDPYSWLAAPLTNIARTFAGALRSNFFYSLPKKRCVEFLDGYTIQQWPGRWATAFSCPPNRSRWVTVRREDAAAPVGSLFEIKQVTGTADVHPLGFRLH